MKKMDGNSESSQPGPPNPDCELPGTNPDTARDFEPGVWLIDKNGKASKVLDESKLDSYVDLGMFIVGAPYPNLNPVYEGVFSTKPGRLMNGKRTAGKNGNFIAEAENYRLTLREPDQSGGGSVSDEDRERLRLTITRPGLWKVVPGENPTCYLESDALQRVVNGKVLKAVGSQRSGTQKLEIVDEGVITINNTKRDELSLSATDGNASLNITNYRMELLTVSPSKPNIPAGIWVSDGKGNVIRVNDDVEGDIPEGTLFRYSSQKLQTTGIVTNEPLKGDHILLTVKDNKLVRLDDGVFTSSGGQLCGRADLAKFGLYEVGMKDDNIRLLTQDFWDVLLYRGYKQPSKLYSFKAGMTASTDGTVLTFGKSPAPDQNYEENYIYKFVQGKMIKMSSTPHHVLIQSGKIINSIRVEPSVKNGTICVVNGPTLSPYSTSSSMTDYEMVRDGVVRAVVDMAGMSSLRRIVPWPLDLDNGGRITQIRVHDAQQTPGIYEILPDGSLQPHKCEGTTSGGGDSNMNTLRLSASAILGAIAGGILTKEGKEKMGPSNDYEDNYDDDDHGKEITTYQ